MSKYDDLNPHDELEGALAADFASAADKRGFSTLHNATTAGHAPAGLPDITSAGPQVFLTIEATQSKGAAQDRELNSIRDHLYEAKNAHPTNACHCLFVSPHTSKRMLDGIRDHNQQRSAEGTADLKILPLSFETFELWTQRLRESEAALYPMKGFLSIMDAHTEFVDDLRIRRLVLNTVFPTDTDLAKELDELETERDQQTLELLVKDLARLENYMRENGVAVGRAAIDTLIYLVFLKLYEEKRERDGAANRLRSVAAFETFRRDGVDQRTRDAQRSIQKLFADVKQGGEFIESQMFSDDETLLETVNDTFVIEHVLPVFGKYDFLGTRIDALGAVYEVLALRAEKDVKVGQFFTPENVVKFMVELADLRYTDVVLDPACGTGRFLIYSMKDMVDKVEVSDVRNKTAEVQEVNLKRLFGADIDPRISKIAKMNMWINGDGKSNIFGGPDYSGLTLHKHAFDGRESFDQSFDVVLTNPPLGELNYQSIQFISPENDSREAAQIALRETIDRMPVLPHKDLTAERLEEAKRRVEKYQREHGELREELQTAARQAQVVEWQALDTGSLSTEEEKRKRELSASDEIKDYKKLRGRSERKKATLSRNEVAVADLEADLRAGNSVWELTGNTLKGGALFLAAIWHFLKSESSPDAPVEWRGGKLLTIIDEGILNTDNYRSVRAFLRSHFYIKAIVSLTRDTFVPISKTTTKTSILYAVKKSDLEAVQKEPIFYAHANKVGLDTKGKVCENHLDQIMEKYTEFQNAVLSSYARGVFIDERFEAHEFAGGFL